MIEPDFTQLLSMLISNAALLASVLAILIASAVYALASFQRTEPTLNSRLADLRNLSWNEPFCSIKRRWTGCNLSATRDSRYRPACLLVIGIESRLDGNLQPSCMTCGRIKRICDP